MASAFTHTLVGAALAASAPRGLLDRNFFALLCLASVSPDLDVIAFALGIPYGNPLGHRGLTHSIPFAAVLSFVIAALCHFRFARGRRHVANAPDSIRRLLWLFGLAFAAIASHGVLDALTDGGLGVGFWIPFDNTRHFFPWRPIPVSPIGIGAFISARGLEILEVEMRLIGAPAIMLGVAVLYIRRRHRAPDGADR